MHISYQPLLNTLKERKMRKEDLRLAYQHGNPASYLQGV